MLTQQDCKLLKVVIEEVMTNRDFAEAVYDEAVDVCVVEPSSVSAFEESLSEDLTVRLHAQSEGITFDEALIEMGLK